MSHDRAALGAFLRSRRDRLTPAQVGMAPFPGPRRVPGLRREELAVAAGLSSDYYSRLEQGRQANISDEVLDSLARTLRLDAVEHAHLRDLAAPTRRRPAASELPQLPDPGLLRVVSTLDHVPVILLGRRAEVLASNLLLRAVLGRTFEPGSSFVRYLFQDPSARERIVDWAGFAAASVAGLRREIGRRPCDRALVALVEELRGADADVARWWDDHGVRDYSPATKTIRHPQCGVLDFGIEVLEAPNVPDQWLVVYTVEPHSTTARMLPVLASWAAEVAASTGISASAGIAASPVQQGAKDVRDRR